MPPADSDREHASKKDMLDGDLLQAVADGRLPEQLAGATSALHEQLAAITREMQSLKAEIHSEQSGLTAQINELARGVGSLDRDDHANPSRASVQLRTDRSHVTDSDSLKVREQLRPARRLRDESDRHEKPTPRSASERRVEFSPSTRDPMPMHQRAALRDRRPQQQPGWMPYIVGFCIVCMGPLRPLLYDAITTLPGLLWQVWSSSLQQEEELPWYDQ